MTSLPIWGSAHPHLWGPILKGKILAYGREPWLGLRFAKLFHAV